MCSPASTFIPAATASSSAARQPAVSAPPIGATPITSVSASPASAIDATIGTGRRAYGTTSSARRPAYCESTTATTSRSP